MSVYPKDFLLCLAREGNPWKCKIRHAFSGSIAFKKVKNRIFKTPVLVGRFFLNFLAISLHKKSVIFWENLDTENHVISQHIGDVCNHDLNPCWLCLLFQVCIALGAILIYLCFHGITWVDFFYFVFNSLESLNIFFR